MAHRYYCENCKKVYESVVRRDGFKCPNCKSLTKEVDGDVKIKDEKVLQGAISSDNKNQIGKLLNFVGVIIIVLSIIGGIIIASDNGVGIGIVVVLYGSFNGILACALGEVINLLQDIKNKK